MSAVEFTVRDHSNWQISMDVTGAPDTTNPEVPSLGTVRPTALGVGLFPHMETGVWEVSSVGVVGPKVRDGQVATKRDYTVTFMEPLEPDSVAPEWVREIAKEWTDRANAVVSGAAPKDFSYDANMRTVEENIGRLEDEIRRRRSPQRASFDTALNALLIRQNLDGTEWAIQQILDEAKHLDSGPGLGDSAGAEFLRALAAKISDALDKRTAELATREH
jgi:hypothetical protein